MVDYLLCRKKQHNNNKKKQLQKTTTEACVKFKKCKKILFKNETLKILHFILVNSLNKFPCMVYESSRLHCFQSKAFDMVVDIFQYIACAVFICCLDLRNVNISVCTLFDFRLYQKRICETSRIT